MVEACQIATVDGAGTSEPLRGTRCTSQTLNESRSKTNQRPAEPLLGGLGSDVECLTDETPCVAVQPGELDRLGHLVNSVVESRLSVTNGSEGVHSGQNRERSRHGRRR